jgi:aminoglycoside phosphotransferase (APT) family kinase protein
VDSEPRFAEKRKAIRDKKERFNRYAQAQTDEVPAMDRVAGWLTEHTPKESGAALVHNDYKYDNLLLDPADLTRVVAVLDFTWLPKGGRRRTNSDWPRRTR